MRLRVPRALPSFRLGGLSVRSFLRSPLTIAALVSLTLIPLLYSGLYLASFWDPFGRMDHVPVALVNEDEPVTVDGEELHAGRDLAERLTRRGDLDWRQVDAEEAARGVANGRYYVSLTIPADFSANLATPSRDGAEPVPALLEANYNDANSYIARQLLGSAFKEVRTAAADTATSDYLDRMFLGFNEIHGRTEEAADGADQLADGTDDAKDGADQLLDGLGDAEDGSGDLSSGLDDAKDGSADLHDGLGKLYDGSKTLADGSTTASDQLDKKVDRLDTLADEWTPVLRENAPDIEEDARTVADAAGDVSKALDDLPDTSQEESAQAQDVHDRLQDYLDTHPQLRATDPELYSLVSDAEEVSSRAVALDDFVRENRDDIETISDKADTVSDLASEMADEAPDLADDVDAARDQVDELNDGLADIAKGSRDLRDGLEDAYAGAGDLDDGLGDLRDGAGRLDGGIEDLHDGAGQLDDGLGDLRDGSHELSSGLDSGVDQIPTFGEGERSSRGDMMSQPVRLSSAIDNEAPNYGTGFAPFFLALSLWVGAMVTFMVLPPVSRRGLASTAPSWRIALAGWLPPMAIGTAQVAVMLSALHLLLGLDAQRWTALFGVLLLTAAAYTAVIQWVGVRFGPAGRVLALVLLMLQLTSAGGTYPIETSPAFFRAIAPYLPMSWVVAAVRHLVSGGDLTVVWQACAVLTGYLVGALLLTWLAVARKRTWTMRELRPALKL